MPEDLEHPRALPERPQNLKVYAAKNKTDWKRVLLATVGLVVFAAIYASPQWPDSVGPGGCRFQLTPEGKGAIALFFLAVLWWWFEVVPAGITGLSVGIMQALFGIRPVKNAFADYMSPAVVFFFATIVLGMGITRSGLAKRVIYKTLSIIGNSTLAVYAGVFLISALLSHFMPATAVASVTFPTLLAVHSLYDSTGLRTNFGKGLFTGMAYALSAAGAATLFGASRSVTALFFLKEVTGKDIAFFTFFKYTSPVVWITLLLLLLFIVLRYRPEKDSIHRFQEKAGQLYLRLGPISYKEVAAGSLLTLLVAGFALGVFSRAFARVDMSALALLAATSMFLLKVLGIKDMEDIPWNTILLIGGVVSLGMCLIDTGASRWIAIKTLPMAAYLGWPVSTSLSAYLFLAGLSVFLLVTGNLVISMGAMAMVLPVTLYLAPYLGLTHEALFFTALISVGMPFSLRAGYAPNALALESGQISSREFVTSGVCAGFIAFVTIFLAVWLIWPAMGMPTMLSR